MSGRGKERNERIVYSTGTGRVCPACGWPAADCRCNNTARTESIPARIVAKLRVEKKGRGVKTVSVVDGLPQNDAFLQELCQELKRACGTGGTVSGRTIELQGDLRERIRDRLLEKGFVVKG